MGAVNHSIASSSFPDELNLAEAKRYERPGRSYVSLKKNDPLDKENHRPVCWLKTFEKHCSEGY